MIKLHTSSHILCCFDALKKKKKIIMNQAINTSQNLWVFFFVLFIFVTTYLFDFSFFFLFLLLLLVLFLLMGEIEKQSVKCKFLCTLTKPAKFWTSFSSRFVRFARSSIMYSHYICILFLVSLLVGAIDMI